MVSEIYQPTIKSEVQPEASIYQGPAQCDTEPALHTSASRDSQQRSRFQYHPSTLEELHNAHIPVQRHLYLDLVSVSILRGWGHFCSQMCTK